MVVVFRKNFFFVFVFIFVEKKLGVLDVLEFVVKFIFIFVSLFSYKFNII